MNGYQFRVLCPCCDSDRMTHLTASTFAGTETTAVAKCAGCGAEWQVTVHLRRVPNAESTRTMRYRKVPT